MPQSDPLSGSTTPTSASPADPQATSGPDAATPPAGARDRATPPAGALDGAASPTGARDRVTPSAGAVDGAAPPVGEREPHSPHSPLGFLDRIRSTPTGRLALKIGVGILGTIVVVAGIIMIPFPGPGWAVVILGLAIWAVEFDWAKRLLHLTRKYVNAWTHWVLKQPLYLRALIGLAGFIFISAVVWASVYLSLDINLYTVIMDFLTGK